MKVQIFHNPRCSKSREALTLLQGRGVALEVIDYQANPRLIERPIVVAGHRAVIGRPPAKVLTLF